MSSGVRTNILKREDKYPDLCPFSTDSLCFFYVELNFKIFLHNISTCGKYFVSTRDRKALWSQPIFNLKYIEWAFTPPFPIHRCSLGTVLWQEVGDYLYDCNFNGASQYIRQPSIIFSKFALRITIKPNMVLLLLLQKGSRRKSRLNANAHLKGDTILTRRSPRKNNILKSWIVI